MPEDRKKDTTEDEDEDEDLVRIDQVVQLWVLHSFLGAVKTNANLNARMSGQICCFPFSKVEKRTFQTKRGKGDAQKEE